ncbi:GNAT family N-acetyltransferase [Knoellia locipacati]|uniref:GNAT family N-acetyltransferase n=1 Tax=Knoellia locipacati TaxID=882824 RepID=UPI00385084F9
MSTLSWRPLSDEDLPALTHLASRCLERDGGLPLLATDELLRQLFRSGPSIGGWDETGELIAAASAFRDGSGRRAVTGLVHPSTRSQGLAAELLKWCRDHFGESPLRVVVETTSPESERFFADIGLRRTFAEHVMRHPLVDIPRVARPPGLQVYPWTEDTVGLFHTAFIQSFATRPGFTNTPKDVWVAQTAEDEGFRPELSRVALDSGGRVAGFVTISDNWIDQVGVVPPWRGRGLGAHLVVRSLRSARKAGWTESWLAVNVDNPAHDLYLRLGYVDAGLRARYEEARP